MADDYAIFKNEFRPVNFAFLEEKIVCPHPSCEGEAVFFRKTDFSNITGFDIQKQVSSRKSNKPLLG